MTLGPDRVPALVALDVDGTLLAYDETLAPAVHDAVRRVVDAGAHVVIATGRSLIATLPVCELFGLTGGLTVASNGAVVADVATGEPLQVRTFDATNAVRYFAEQIPDALLAVEELGVGFRVSGHFPLGELSGQMTVVPHSELLVGPVSRLVVRWPDGDRDRLVRLAREAGLHGVDYAIGYSAWLDFMPAGVSKASGLELVREQLGVPRDRTLAIGDGHNDIEMVQWAAHGVAMADSPQELLAVADEVAPSVRDDGAAAVLSRWF